MLRPVSNMIFHVTDIYFQLFVLNRYYLIDSFGTKIYFLALNVKFKKKKKVWLNEMKIHISEYYFLLQVLYCMHWGFTKTSEAEAFKTYF